MTSQPPAPRDAPGIFSIRGARRICVQSRVVGDAEVTRLTIAQNAGPSTALIACAIDSTQRLSVLSSSFEGRAGEKRVMEKMENDKAVSHLSHNPGYDDGWSWSSCS